MDDEYRVLVNHFELKLPPNDDLTLFMYQVSSDNPAWKDATRNKRRAFMQDLIDQELKEDLPVIASDYRDKIVANKKLFKNHNEWDVQLWNFKPGTRDNPEIVSLTVKLIDHFNMKELNDHVNGTNISYKDRGAAEAMNMVVSKAVADGSSQTFMAANNKFFYHPG
jgi:hypothetical protein